MIVIQRRNSEFDMFQEEMKVGLKRQVIIEKSSLSAVSVFERIAKGGPSVNFIEPHLYQEELERRNGT